MKKLARYFPNMTDTWTAKSKLPGGHLNGDSFANFVLTLEEQYPWAPKAMLRRYAGSYGDLTYKILKNYNKLNELGKHFGADLYEAEVDYLIHNEWVQTCDDLIWRRSKLGLFLSKDEINVLRGELE